MLSKTEFLYLQGQKQVSNSYEYKLKSILRKKITNFLDKELPLLKSLFPDLDLNKNNKINSEGSRITLTKFSKIGCNDNKLTDLTKISKYKADALNTNLTPSVEKTVNDCSNLNIPVHGNAYSSEANTKKKRRDLVRNSINNPCELIKNTESSGGVEDLFDEDHIIRLSISPSQGDDPGFKSRPEHPFYVFLNTG